MKYTSSGDFDRQSEPKDAWIHSRHFTCLQTSWVWGLRVLEFWVLLYKNYIYTIFTNERDGLPNPSYVICYDLSSLEFSSNTVCYTDPRFDEEVKSIFSAWPSLAEKSLQNEFIYLTWRSTETYLHFYISSFG